MTTIPKPDWPAALANQLRMLGIESQREVLLVPGRKFRTDLVVRDLAIEVDGGGFIQGRHSRGSGIEKDAEKQALVTIAGYRTLRVTPRQIESGEALGWIERALPVKLPRPPETDSGEAIAATRLTDEELLADLCWFQDQHYQGWANVPTVVGLWLKSAKGRELLLRMGERP